jgi:hypothetical protein
MKNPFRQLREQQAEIERLWDRVVELERQLYGRSNLLDPIAQKTVNERVEYLEDSLREGSAHTWAKLIGAILRYLDVDVEREWVPDEWYKPPAPPVHEVVKLTRRSKPFRSSHNLRKQ